MNLYPGVKGRMSDYSKLTKKQELQMFKDWLKITKREAKKDYLKNWQTWIGNWIKATEDRIKELINKE